MRPFAELLAEAEVMHRGHACPGQVLGVRMAMAGCRALGIDEPAEGRRLIVFVEIDRCAADAIAAVTGCRLGRRTLKFVDYGKMAATFLDTHRGRAVRVIARESSREAAWRYAPPGLDKHDAQREAYKVMPEHELLEVQQVTVHLGDEDRPGPPISRVLCDRCGEGINDRREVRNGEQALCVACASRGYYQVIDTRS